MKSLLIVCLLLTATTMHVPGQDKSWEYYTFLQLQKEYGELGRSYYRFVDGSDWSAGIYGLKTGTVDEQSPHELDELYYVIKGRSMFLAGNDTTEVVKGSILFVKALVTHRFYNIEEDLIILVIFSKRTPVATPDLLFTNFDTKTVPILKISTMDVTKSISSLEARSGFLIAPRGMNIQIHGESKKYESAGVFYFEKGPDYSMLENDQPLLAVTVEKL